ncbi:MAG: hypothetical protein ACOCRO_10655 [Halanaerobiales bacterium]
MELEKMTLEELEKIAIEINKECKKRHKQLEKIKKVVDEARQDYEFDFYARYSARSKRRYVAKLEYNNKRFDYYFYAFDISKGDEVVISGKYKVKEGEVIEKFEVDTKELFIAHNKELVYLCDKDEAVKINAIKTYMRNEMDIDSLIEFCTDKIRGDVIDELKD